MSSDQLVADAKGHESTGTDAPVSKSFPSDVPAHNDDARRDRTQLEREVSRGLVEG